MTFINLNNNFKHKIKENDFYSDIWNKLIKSKIKNKYFKSILHQKLSKKQSQSNDNYEK